MIYKLFRKLIFLFFKNFLIKKRIKNTAYYLHYRISQNLRFFFQNKILYETKIQKSIRDFINPDDVIFDIGANIGQYSLFFCSIIKNRGQIISFEPNKECYDLFNFNLSYNNIKNVKTYKIGVGDEDTSLPFYEDKITGGRVSSFQKEKYLEKSNSKVEIKTLDTIIQENIQPNFIKIDVEG